MKNIVIVDDSKTIQLQVQSFAKKLFPNINVVAAKSGEEALEKFPKIEGDLLVALIDYNMDGMTGLELIQQLDDIDRSHIVLCTANIQESIYQKAEKQGVTLIEKPLTKDKFESIVNNFLKVS